MLVSIIIPIYNTEQYIERTISSVLSQSYQLFEILAINDGSSDSSLEIITNLAKKDSRIQVIDKLNSGVSDTRNLGINLSKGEIIAFLDADDIWLPNKLEIQVGAMIKNRQLAWSITNCATIDEDDNILENAISKKPNNSPHFDELITWTTSSFKAMSGLMIWKESAKNIRFNRKISSPADRDFMIRLAKISDAIYIDEVLWQYRILLDSMSKNEVKVIKDMLRQYQDYDDEFYGSSSLKRKSLNRLYFIIYRTYLKNNKFLYGLYYFFKYIFSL